MIICHCNRIDHREIEAAANELTREDPWRVLTPVLVYKTLGKRPRCGCCLSLAANIIHTRKLADLGCCKSCPAASLALEATRTAETAPKGPSLVEESGE